ncbi:MAG: Hpt domain-containing protein [Oscillospiraceae bacterium]|nr:Hpt domain-containing protein [Oscillospiraceae bacterium]
METNINNNENINIADALARIGGNEKLYKTLLGRFLEGNHLEVLNDAINSGDREEATRQAHTLKGVSANLSLVKINTLTAEIERLLHGGEDYEECLNELKQAFDSTVAEINEIIAT